MPRAQNLPNVRDGVGAGEEGPVEPPAPLANELGDGVGDVGLADGAFDVFEDPEGRGGQREGEEKEEVRKCADG